MMHAEILRDELEKLHVRVAKIIFAFGPQFVVY